MGAKIIKLDCLIKQRKFVVADGPDQMISDLLAQALGKAHSECKIAVAPTGTTFFITPEDMWIMEIEDVEFIG